MTLSSGTKLGPYEIQSALGAGGMGEVYRARDTRLNRDVAIKILSASFAADSDRLRRFEQEARTVAALNHPNILGIHDIGTHDGTPYLVSEFLEGDTLREKLQAGPLPIRRAIEYALGIAHGLAAAHEKGIVHRDLKPENIFILRNGNIKILDFGLAKLVRSDASSEPAATLGGSATLPGMVLGTVGYMSPEQVRGEVADQRSDIFSFGAVLFEMLTGKRAFKRDTSAETMTAILREEPPELTETGWQGPLGLQRILARCLEKNVERRFQSASDLGFAIESLSGSSISQGVAQVKTSRSWIPWTAVALGALLLGAAALLAGRWSVRQSSPPKFTRLTYEKGYTSNARFAKDGETVVYSAQWNGDPMQVMTVRTEFPQSTKVDLPSAALLAVSSTGDLQLLTDLFLHSNSGNFLNGTMAQAQMAGGSARALAKEVIAADYSPDGKALAVSRHANGKVQLEFPAGKMIYQTSGYVDYIRVSPIDNTVAFLEHPVYGDDRGWVSIVDPAGNHRRLTKEFDATQGLAWSRTGKEIWFTAAGEEAGTDQQLFAVDLSGKVREIFGAPQRIRLFDIAADGRVLLSSEQYGGETTGIDPVSGKERRGLDRFDGSGLADILPDGTAVLMYEWGGNAGPLYQVFYRKLDGSAPVVLGKGGRARFSPDHTTAAALVFSQPPQIALLPIGTGESRMLSLGEITSVSQSLAWFPDGKHLLVVGTPAGQTQRTYELDMESGKLQVVGPVGWKGTAVSRDGKHIAGFSSAGEVVVFDLDTQQMRSVPGAGTDELQGWTKDGQGLLVLESTLSDARIYRIEVATGKRTLLRAVELNDKAGSVGTLRMLYAEDSKTYVYRVQKILGSLYVVDGLK